MKRSLKWLLTTLACILVLAGCTTKGQVLEAVQKSVQHQYHQPSKTANQMTKTFRFNLPKGLKIDSKGTHNIVLKDKTGNLYILFVNGLEGKMSEVNYKNDLASLKRGAVKKTFSDQGTFNYIILRPIKNNKVELIVGRGGIKMSTKTTLENAQKASKQMATIIQSVTKL
jgi:predicted small lipoprotein YifL